MRDFAVGGAALGVLSGMYFYTYAAIQLPVGMLMDKFGPRKLMSVAALVCMFASVWFAYSDSLLSASLSRAIIGGSVAFSFVGTLTIASHFFPPRRFALAAGVLLAVGMCGAIAGQAPLRLIMEQSGWRQLYLMLAIVALLLAVSIYLIVPRRPVTPDADDLAIVHSSESMFAGLRAVLANRQSWLCAGVGFGLSVTMLSLAGLWAVPWLTTTRGFSNADAATTASFMFAGFAIGSSSVGWLSEKLGQRKRLILIGSAFACLTLLLINYGNFTSRYTLSALFLLNGLTCGTMALCFVLVRAHTAAEHNSTALGLINMCIVGSGAIMQPFIGWLLDLRWSGDLVDGARLYTADAYQFAFSTLILATVLALICTLLITEKPVIAPLSQ